MANNFAINEAAINGSSGGSIQVRVSASSPLGSAKLSAFHDWSSVIPEDAVINYLMDIVGTTTERIPISSWQGTLQVDRASYLQAVIPACGQYLDFINAQTDPELVIYRRASFDGQSFTQEMARSVVTSTSVARGSTNYSATISGYESTFSALSESSVTTRTLNHVQSQTTYNEGIRVRCGIDWFLRPGQNAISDGNEFTVSYINYIGNDSGAYMDVGESQN